MNTLSDQLMILLILLYKQFHLISRSKLLLLLTGGIGYQLSSVNWCSWQASQQGMFLHECNLYLYCLHTSSLLVSGLSLFWKLCLI